MDLLRSYFAQRPVSLHTLQFVRTKAARLITLRQARNLFALVMVHHLILLMQAKWFQVKQIIHLQELMFLSKTDGLCSLK
jgi:hypothetical protein